MQGVPLGTQAWLGSATVLKAQRLGSRQVRLPGLLPQPASGLPVAAAFEDLDSREAIARLGHVEVELGPLLQLNLMHRPALNIASIVLTLAFGTGAQCSYARSAERGLLRTQAEWLVFLEPGLGTCKIPILHRR